MKNFDIDNLVNPELIQTALVVVHDKLHSVTDMTTDKIVVSDIEHNHLSISNEEWQPIFLDDLWLNNLLGPSHKIKNASTGDQWVVKKCGRYQYLTVFRNNSSGENPVIPIHFVHELQEWYYRLTEKKLPYDLANLKINMN